jgi:hypothetical protein
MDDDSGLSFTGYKNTLQKNNNYREMLEAVDAFLKENGFFVRSIVGTPSVEEDEIVKKFLEYIQTDAIYLESLGIESYQKQVETWIRTEVGETDIIVRDYNDSEIITCVIEAKKDRCGGYEAAQLWGYMAYHNCKKGILLSGVPPPVTLTTDLFTRSVTLTSFPTTNSFDLNPELYTSLTSLPEFNGYSIVNCAAPTPTL